MCVSTDNVGITGYEVRRDGGAAEASNGADGLSHTFTGLAFNSTHLAEVRARDAANNWSAQSTALSVTTATVDTANQAQLNTHRPN